MFDIGYIKVKNDLSVNTVLGNFSEKLDGDMFTVGLGAEYLAKAGSVNVTPHFGTLHPSRHGQLQVRYGIRSHGSVADADRRDVLRYL